MFANRVAVVWSPEPGLVVTFGYVGEPEAALALARSVQPVDIATWESSTAPSLPNQGCAILFC